MVNGLQLVYFFSSLLTIQSVFTLQVTPTHSHTDGRGEKLFTCTTCSKSFRSKGILTIHIRTHTGEKPFTCTTCNKTFRTKSHLTAHTRIHTGEKPLFTCTTCNKTFVTKDHLIAHI
uniref:C2H2-type domain-containing protein n=1 Tax=Labrus bergylta TaxID=56723 RepID=A0A3Q3L011_9LABR